ncbi:MAG: HlyD family secretion protein [Desulfobacterales bacterium]
MTDKGSADHGAIGKKPSDQEPTLLSKMKEHWRWLVMAGLCLALFIFGYWWFFMRGRVSTDDAYVKAESASISSRVPGSVAEVRVENDMAVEKGDVLVVLDQRDYHVALEAAEAMESRIGADIKAAETNLSVLSRDTEAQFEQAKAKLEQIKNQRQAKSQDLNESIKNRVAALAQADYAKKNFERFEKLYRKGSVSQQERDNKFTLHKEAQSALEALGARIRADKASLDAAQRQVDQAEQNLRIAQSNLAKVDAQRFRIDSLKAQQRQASAQMDQAKLNLSYCTIRAPIQGLIAQKNIQVGNRVGVGQPFMAVVPLQAVYAEANFKETDLGDVKPGQRATITADIYPGHVFHGWVSGIRPGTGAAFALLPPQNASGNWIKVVQRLPVRIEFDRPLPAEYPLRIGLSLSATIYINDRVGATAESP